MQCANTVAAQSAKVPPFASYTVHTKLLLFKKDESFDRRVSFAPPIKSRSSSMNEQARTSSKHRFPPHRISIHWRDSDSKVRQRFQPAMAHIATWR